MCADAGELTGYARQGLMGKELSSEHSIIYSTEGRSHVSS